MVQYRTSQAENLSTLAECMSIHERDYVSRTELVAYTEDDMRAIMSRMKSAIRKGFVEQGTETMMVAWNRGATTKGRHEREKTCVVYRLTALGREVIAEHAGK